MKYTDYVNTNYSPKRSDLICDFYIEPMRASLKEAAGAVAAESSIGTWAEIETKSYVKRLSAKVFEAHGAEIRIAYPIELFEAGNMPNMLSSVAGNVFGMKIVKNLRLNDIKIPEKLARSFKGPKHGIGGIRKLLGVKKRPLVGTIIKPKLGLVTEDHAKKAFDAWVGGCDIVKDDENLSSQKFNPFKRRLEKTLRLRDKAERLTGEKKIYMINVTAETNEMLRRAKLAKRNGCEYAMIDIISAGWSALQTLREQELGLVIHAHRAGHAALTKNAKHGISMKVIAKLSRIVGVDQLHVGTVVGKMSETREEVLENCGALKDGMYGIKPCMPVASGGLHAGMVPELIRIFGNDFVIQAGGGIHSLGTVAGAKSMRQAVDAVLDGIALRDYAKNHKELGLALKKF
ncbi:MAG: type III ribulose-bisphosphate carboxylase [Candidatus Aenigmatarchaeota archaeon]